MAEDDPAVPVRAFVDTWRDHVERHSHPLRDPAMFMPTSVLGCPARMTEPQLRAVLDELEHLRAVRTCGSTAVLYGGNSHVCVLPFGHGPEHRDRNGKRWQIYDAPPESDDALRQLLRTQGVTLPLSQQPWFNADSTPQQLEDGNRG